jgi:uncharacterized protein with von Willebrand factor type A (vWA) domain
VQPGRRRRHAASARGTPDLRRSLRQMVREPATLLPAYTRPRFELPPLVVLLDISGSMDRYSRLFLHYVHGLTRRHLKVHTFTFGTRLTNITRHLRHRDVDAALAAAGREALDWEGGTRIGACLHAFNRDWSRRVLGQGAVVILISDGLERGDPDLLAVETERLALSCRRLIWINPLLRWDGFAPKAAGIRAMLPHVDSFRAGHNIAALEALARAISRRDDPGEKARLIAALADT